MMPDRRMVIAGLSSPRLPLRSPCSPGNNGSGAIRRHRDGPRHQATQRSIGSGSDAVQTIGNSMSNETMVHAAVREGMDAIDQAPGGDSVDNADEKVLIPSFSNT